MGLLKFNSWSHKWIQQTNTKKKTISDSSGGKEVLLENMKFSKIAPNCSMVYEQTRISGTDKQITQSIKSTQSSFNWLEEEI